MPLSFPHRGSHATARVGALRRPRLLTALGAAALALIHLSAPPAVSADTTPAPRQASPERTASAAPAQPRAAREESPDAPVSAAERSTVTAPGKFTAPARSTLDRPDFTAASGTPEPAEIREIPESGTPLALWALAGLTALCLIATGAAAARLSRLRTSSGEVISSLTFASKLSLAMGTMATMILGLGTFSLFAQRGAHKSSLDAERFAETARLVQSIGPPIRELELVAADFSLHPSDDILLRYRDLAATVSARIAQTSERLTDPALSAELQTITSNLDKLFAAFARLVASIDDVNATLDSQMGPAATRVAELLTEIRDTAHADGDPDASITAATSLDGLSTYRLAVIKLLRASDEKAAALLGDKAANAIAALRELETNVQNPIRRAWLHEAIEGFEFYADRAAHVLQAAAQRQHIDQQELAPAAMAIEHAMHKLSSHVDTQRAALVDAAASSASAAAVKLFVASLIVSLAAVIITVTLIRSLVGPMSRVVQSLQSIAAGDLSRLPLNSTTRDELGELARACDAAQQSLTTVISDLDGTSRTVAAASTEISASAEELAKGMNEQSGQVAQISAAVEQMASSITEVASKSQQAAGDATASGNAAQKGGKVVAQTIEDMQAINDAVSAGAASVMELGKRGEQIGQIIAVINDIADQTNLLALNAAIEAARAGEHGRGFAVVADEVRKLADRTTKATEEIGQSIRAIQEETTQAVKRMTAGTEQVKLGVGRATEAGQSLEQIVSSAQQVAGLIQAIAAAAQQQSAASEQIAKSIEGVAATTSQAAHASEQAASAVADLSSKAETIRATVERFKLAA